MPLKTKRKQPNYFYGFDSRKCKQPVRYGLFLHKQKLLQTVFAGFWQQQGQDVDAILCQSFALISCSRAANRPRMRFAIVDLPGYISKSTAHVFGVGHDVTRQRKPRLLHTRQIVVISR